MDFPKLTRSTTTQKTNKKKKLWHMQLILSKAPTVHFQRAYTGILGNLRQVGLGTKTKRWSRRSRKNSKRYCWLTSLNKVKSNSRNIWKNNLSVYIGGTHKVWSLVRKSTRHLKYWKRPGHNLSLAISVQ